MSRGSNEPDNLALIIRLVTALLVALDHLLEHIHEWWRL